MTMGESLDAAREPTLPPRGGSAADERWMREALAEARLAGGRGEVPVGAVVVLDGAVVGRGGNQPIHATDPTAHAEIVALRDAALTAGNYRLTGAALYVTVETVRHVRRRAGPRPRRPARLRAPPSPRPAPSARSCGCSITPALNHRVEVAGGVLESECTALMRAFFAERRVADKDRSRAG